MMLHKNKIQMIPIDQIKVMNPRERSEKSFQEIKGNIATVGLKKPVTVRPSDHGEGFDLVCGEGRLKTFIALGQKVIPAIVRIDLSREDAYVMSLVENMARRQHTSMDLLKGIGILDAQGYSSADISRKTGLALSYVSGILSLSRKGEEKLLSAVEKGSIPLWAAIKIVSSPAEEQNVLQEVYENKDLCGKKFVRAQHLLKARRISGKQIKAGKEKKSKEEEPLSAQKLVQEFKNYSERMRFQVEKAQRTETKLMIIVEALYNLLRDENFTTLLRAENLNTIPKDLDQLIELRRKSHV